MRVFTLIICLFFSVTLMAQTSEVSTSDNRREILMTFIAPADISAKQIGDFLLVQSGVEIIQFCHSHCAVYAIVDLSIIKNEEALHRLVETSFPGTACFRKECKERDLNDFFKLCYEEIAKPE